MKSRQEIEDELADSIVLALKKDIASEGKASLLVSGGSTPKALFQNLASRDLDWASVSISLVDERYLADQHADQNGRMVKECLLQGKAQAANFVPLVFNLEDSRKNLEEARKQIGTLLRPFSAVVLGMGTDGHTASLFPDAEALDEGMNLSNNDQIILTKTKSAAYDRISLTRSALLDSKNLYLHFYGEEKEEVFKKASISSTYKTFPIQAFINQSKTRLQVYWTK